MKHSPARLISRARFKPWHLALCVLLVGWVPSLLVAYLSYGTLGRALDEKITADAQSLTGFLAKFIEDNLVRTGETVDYYRTLPSTAAVLQGATSPPPPAPTPPPSRGSRGRDSAAPAATPAATPTPSAQEWLGGIFYSQTRVDGLFLTDPAGRLLAAVPPPDPGLLGRDYASEQWKPPADPAANAGFTISPVYPRPSDNRPVASVVVAVRDRNDTLLGYLGADTLTERMGRRLAVTQLARRGLAATQLIDGRGFPLFTRALSANRPGGLDAPPALLAAIRARKTGHVELGETAYFFHPIERAGWTAVLEEPAAEVHQPVRDMRSQTVLLVGWLVAGCAVAAYLLSKLYRRQINASLVVEREQVFSENILANMPIGVALIHPTSERLMQANDRFLAIVQSLGALPAGRELADVGFGELNIAAPGTLATVVRTGTPFQAVEQRRTPATAGGGSPTIYLTLNLLRLQDSKGGVLGVLCLVEDSTEDFTLRQELIDANATKDQFFAQLSHELRTPLSPVITMVAELEQLTGGDGVADPAARNALEVIRRNVQLEARLIDDLLDITRIRSGKLGLNREVTNVHRAIRLAIEITREDLRAKDLQLEVHLDAAHHHADADPARLQQVFWNLIKNAVKFTPAGRRIVIRTLNPEQGNNRAGPAARLRVEVCDEGIGIAPEHLARIFNAFDQGQSGITRRFGGLGLGLAISKALIEAHGGALAAASAGPDQGATFTVDLDTAPAPAPAEPPAAVAAPVNGNGKTTRPASATAPKPAARSGARVLLVDDHYDTCLGMKLLLGRRGYQVTVAHSVAEGLAAAGSEPFDLLISDLGLPDGNGCDLMRALRGRPDGGPPGIALSGFGMESDLEKTAAAGFHEHLIKPVDFDRLDAAMHRLLAVRDAV